MDPDHSRDLRIDALLQRFKAAAVQWHLGHFLDLKALQTEARPIWEAAMKELDSLTSDGRAALIPLLQDKDDGIRAIAAAELLDTKPDIALPVLHDLQDNCITEASFTAFGVLFVYEKEQADLNKNVSL